MSPLEQVWDAVNFFTKNPQYVKIEEDGIQVFSEIGIKAAGLSDNKKTVPRPSFSSDNKVFVAYQLMASAVNYCYWYGSYDFRPNKASSGEMYRLLDASFLEASMEEGTKVGGFHVALEMACFIFSEKILKARFPLASRRLQHLKELITHLPTTVDRLLVSKNLEDAIDLVLVYPGMGEDIFLKRLSLFFLLVHNHLDWFDSEINKLPVPADYQLPKMLEHFGVLVYSRRLKEIITNGELIPSGSIMECEIRASTILACKKISEKTGKNIGFIDQYIWGRRKESVLPFHLTITTDY